MSIILSISLIYFIHKIFTCKEGKLFAIKEIAAQLYLKLKKRNCKARLDNYDHFNTNDVKKVNILPPDKETYLEHRKQCGELSESVFIFGSNSKGDLLSCQITIRDQWARVWVQLKTETGNTYVLPFDKPRKVTKTDLSCFAASGLKLRCLVPFRKWRISFNGMMRNINNKTDATKGDVHVKFNFIWTASSNVYDHLEIPNSILAKYIAGLSWKSWLPKISMLPERRDALEQAGNIMGTVSIGTNESKEVLLWGARIRSSELNDTSILKIKEYFAYMSEGDYVHISEIGYNNSNKFVHGFIVHSNSLGGSIDSIVLDNVELKGEITFSRGKHEFQLKVESENEVVKIARDSLQRVNEKIFDFGKAKMNGDEGYSMVVTTTFAQEQINLEKLNVPVLSSEILLDISDARCKVVESTGGKGSSLAELMDISKTSKNNFTVPRGFVVTTHSFSKFLNGRDVNPKCEVELQKTLRNEDPNQLKIACERTVSEISNIELPPEIQREIESKLKAYPTSTLFAVRSSASGEDSEEMSAAGQMDTYLGIQGQERLVKHVAKCWASQFSYTAIQYKRQNGQKILSPMAVVVQEMIPAERAGVMFTCDPLTGNPENITITANYGLGESVVSATAEPDSIVMKRDTDGHITKHSIQVGRKSTKVVVYSDGKAGVTEENVSSEESLKCCLSDKDAHFLATLGNQLEEAFGCPLDIEWAINGENVYLLQARPVTTFDKETDFEIIHEMDGHLRSEKECLTMANTGEVMPGATTELGVTFILKILELSSLNHWLRKDQVAFPIIPYLQRNLMISSKHVMFNVLDTMYRFQKGKERVANTKAGEIAMFGRILDDKEILIQAVKRNSFYEKASNVVKNIIYFSKDLYNMEKNLQKAAKFINNFEMNLDESLCAEKFYDEILQNIFLTPQLTSCHSFTTISSSICNLILLTVLAKANNDTWDDKVYSDFSKLLSKCKQVESADVPNAIQELALIIKDCIDVREFQTMTTEQALSWLQSSDTAASSCFKDFISKHGHRCIKEFDLAVSPWRSDPTPLVKSLQEMVATVRKTECSSSSSVKDIINSLKVPINWKTRFILRFVVPFGQNAVGRRERSKSVMIKTVDHFRKAFQILSKKMVQEVRLPDENLIYYLTLIEISQLFETRSARLIQKAVKRRKLHPIIDAYRFPEIMKGLPTPVNLEMAANVDCDGDIIMSGTPVSQGRVKARVRVATNLDEASKIQPGEILIAYSTDIGWSPYFPMLSGVVTELGGLISHGAVVAREYGLPCVVALHGATSIFKTGEMAILDGTKGTIQKVSS